MSGFTCQAPIYSYPHTSGNATLTLGQNTGTNWASASFTFVPQGTPFVNGSPEVSWNNSVTLNNGLYTGALTQIMLPVSGPVPIGTWASGTIWAKYQTNIGGTYYYTQIGAVEFKAT